MMRRKLLITGDRGCGKTSLLSLFALGYLPTHYVPTVFENYVSDCSVDGRLVRLALWDTAGQEDYELLRPLAYSEAHIILVGFSVDNPYSLANAAHKWIEEANARCPGVRLILVGLKKDLRESSPATETMKTQTRFVTTEEGIKTAARIDAGEYLECSSLTGEGVDEVFEAAVRAALLPFDKRKRSSCIIL